MGWNWNCAGFEVSSGENVWRRVKRGDTVAGCDESVTDIGRIARQKENEQLYTGRHFPPKLVTLRRVLRAAWGMRYFEAKEEPAPPDTCMCATEILHSTSTDSQSPLRHFTWIRIPAVLHNAAQYWTFPDTIRSYRKNSEDLLHSSTFVVKYQLQLMFVMNKKIYRICRFKACGTLLSLYLLSNSKNKTTWRHLFSHSKSSRQIH